jgi:cardiolipin synthase
VVQFSDLQAIPTVFTAPNIITFIRLLLVPAMVYLLLEEMYGTALAVFVAAALSDAIDGFLARHFNQHSEIGAVLDPAADKLMIVCTAVTLMALKQMPTWIGVLVVLRDAVIVAGFLAYRWLRGHVDMAPSLLGKFNTGLVFMVFALVLANAAGLIDARGWLQALYALLAASIVASGVQYVWVWSQKAAHPERGHQGSSE